MKKVSLLSDIIENLVLVRLMKDRISECINSSDKMKAHHDNKISCISFSEKESMSKVLNDMKEAMSVYEERCVELLRE